MTGKISERPVPPLDPPERFAGGEVVAAARCPVDVSTYPRRHVIVVKHAGERQTFSVHEVAHMLSGWADASPKHILMAWTRSGTHVVRDHAGLSSRTRLRCRLPGRAVRRGAPGARLGVNVLGSFQGAAAFAGRQTGGHRGTRQCR